MTRKRFVWFVAGIFLAAIPGGIMLQQRSRAAAETGRIAVVLAQASEAIASARQADLLALAAKSFATASQQIRAASDLLAQQALPDASVAAAEALRLALAAVSEAHGNMPEPKAATLLSMINTVLYRPANGVAWSNATELMTLFDQDRLSTKERARASVRFDEGNEMRLEENSVMVVERFVQSRTSSTVAMTLSVPEGSMRSVVTRKDDRDVRLEIRLPHAGVVIDTAALAGGRAEVGTSVHPDQTDRVAVYTGQAEIQGPSGDKVVLRQNQYAEVSPDGKLTAARELPGSAIILLPGRNSTVYTTSQRPEVTFQWKIADTCGGFRLEVTRGSGFNDILVDERVTKPRFTYGNLAPGRYEWRVSCMDDKGTQGAYSDVGTFEVVQETRAPKLAVLAPEANSVVADAAIEARCRAEGDLTVFINGEEAKALGGGVYTRSVTLTAGLNTVVYEAVDPSGNVIYNSRLVTRRP